MPFFSKIQKLASKKSPSFTLVEALFSLVFLSLILLLFQGALQQFFFFKDNQLASKQEDFHLFLMQLEYEMKGFTFKELKGKQITFEDEEGKKAIFQPYLEMIRKSYKTGHHPLVMDIKTWNVKKENTGFLVEVQFLNHQTYEGKVRFEFEKESE